MRNCSKCKKQHNYKGNQCYDCLKKSPSKTPGTLQYFKAKTWARLNECTVNGARPRWGHKAVETYLRRGKRLEMSKGEFYNFCDKNKDIIIGLYREGKKPSLDRVDGYGHYGIDNIRIISLKDNLSRSRVLEK